MSDYQEAKQKYENDRSTKLGVQAAATWNLDPKRLGFVLSRYKFVAKVLSGKSRVLEVGSGDAWASRIVKQQVNTLDCIDIDKDFIRIGNELIDPSWQINLREHDALENFATDVYDAAFALDVFEHIDPLKSDLFLSNLSNAIKDSGVLVIGVPTLESQKFSKPNNGHINCTTGTQLKKRLENFFHNVFVFSMNDEVIHTGMFEMSNYLLCICSTKKLPK